MSTHAFDLFPAVLGAALLVALLALVGNVVTAHHLHATPPATTGRPPVDGAGFDTADAYGAGGTELTAMPPKATTLRNRRPETTNEDWHIPSAPR
ncbi:hypothetical protein [Streptomyces sp. NPDC007100]|uniref:hypothetical protein n=1 Tax=Streptomyces sp. NPDC007100 TaxID=3155602 RepID=UPI0033C5E773